MTLRTVVFVLIYFVFIGSSVYVETLSQNFVLTSDNFTTDELEEARKKKKGADTYLVPLLFGFLLLKSIIFPLVFKAVTVMSGIAVLLGTMSLIMSSIVTFVKLAVTSTPPVKIVHKVPYINWAKDDASAQNYYDVENNDLKAPHLQRIH